MSTVVVLGEEVRIGGFALAGVRTVRADTPQDVLTSWRDLDDDTAFLILTPMAAETLGDRTAERPRLLSTVIPE